MKKLTLTGILLFTTCVIYAQQVTLGTLLDEMVTRENMAMYPEQNYKTKQFSSYDRRSDVPGGEGWFANYDHTEFLRLERTKNGEEWVMFDSRSPGVIVRWWMTFGGFVEGAGQGIIRIYIDGAETPVIEGTAYEVMSGGAIVGPPLSTSVSELTPYNRRGHNVYLPIPYGKSCKITYQSEKIEANAQGEITNNDLAIYYIVNFREYEAGTEVESFNSESLTRYSATLKKAQHELSFPFNKLFAQPPQETLTMRILRPGEEMSLEMEGAQYIKAIMLTLDADSISRALRSTIITLQFDEKKTLEMPIGEFFGTGYEINPYETFYTKVYREGTMMIAWPMPFQSGARIKISNISNQIVKIQNLKVYADKWHWDERSMYFGGSWKQFYNKQSGGPKNPEDLNFNALEGKGVYVGDLVTLYNSAPSWWGEGDEKIYVDGEAFPSHFGTGTEDYYGYAWARPEAFSHPFIAQPDGSGNQNVGTTVNIRYRTLDKIPFSESLKMTVELWHWRATLVNYAPATFFYLRPGGLSKTEFDQSEANKPLAFRKETTYNPTLRSGIVQGENMEPLRIDAGELSSQTGKTWEDNAHLWWRRADVDDALELKFISDKGSANANIELQLTKAKDYGIVDISINDTQKITFDGYAPNVSVEKIQMKNMNISEGINTLKIVVKGKNDKALEGNMFGIDYLEVK